MIKPVRAERNSGNFIDYKIGFAGAIVMSGIVFGINYFSKYEIPGSMTAALKTQDPSR